MTDDFLAEYRQREIDQLHQAAQTADPLTAIDGPTFLVALQPPRVARDVLHELAARLVAAGQLDLEAAGAALWGIHRRDNARISAAVSNARRSRWPR